MEKEVETVEGAELRVVALPEEVVMVAGMVSAV